jgi:hypothetical protein
LTDWFFISAERFKKNAADILLKDMTLRIDSSVFLDSFAFYFDREIFKNSAESLTDNL